MKKLSTADLNKVVSHLEKNMKAVDRDTFAAVKAVGKAASKADAEATKSSKAAGKKRRATDDSEKAPAAKKQKVSTP